MEIEIFDWESWNIIDTFQFAFSGVALKIPIGPHSIGTIFSTVVIKYDTGELELYKEESTQVPEVFKLELRVVQ